MRRKIAVSVVAALLTATVLALAGEVYVRRTQSYIVSQQERQRRLGLVEQNPGLLIQYTSKGKRLIPGAKVIVKHHALSGADIPININSLGFRGEEVALDPTPGVPRILMLGDSITWGDYVRDEVKQVRAAHE